MLCAARGLGITSAIMVAAVAAPTAARAQEGSASLACGSQYSIGRGDSLGSIATRAYGDPKRYDILLDANRDVIGENPNAIVPGMVISVPCLGADGNPMPIAVAAEDAEAMEAAIASTGPLEAVELETLFGPVALFPDQVLTQVLIASTYPLDVVKADRFLKENPEFSPKERADATAQQSWDPSVQQLAAGFPEVITRMADHIDWTEQAGEAVLAQTEDVLAAIQRLRATAQDYGYLADNDVQSIEVTNEVISIVPADPTVVYVPTYSSEVVYAAPVSASPSYDPYYYGYDGDDWTDALAAGAIIFGGALVLDEIFDDDDWDGDWDNGGSIDWDGGDINIDRGDINVDRGDISIGSGNVDIGSGNVGIGSGNLDIGSGNLDIGSGNVGIGNGDRPPLGSGERPGIGDGSRSAAGERPARPSQLPARIGDAEGDALAGRDRTFSPDAASRDAARQKIETRKSTSPGVATLPASRPAAQAATRKPSAASSAKARPSSANRAQAATRPANVSKPKANRSPSKASSYKSSSAPAFKNTGGSRASAGSSRGRYSASGGGGGGGRRR